MIVWLRKILDSFSHLANVVFLNGNVNESVSGRLWRTQSKAYKVVDFIFYFDQDHCLNSHLNDVKQSKSFITLVEKE